MIHIKKLALICLLSISLHQLKAQVVKEFGLGVGAICNFTVPSFGGEARGIFILSDHWAVVPQIQYYPSFNRFHDLYLGTSIHFNFTPSYRWGLYLLGHGSYHNWLNYEQSNNYKAKEHNWNLEPGLGIMKNYGCVRPYAEARYNIKWNEGNLRIGLAFFFGDCGHKHEYCPAYTYNN